MKGIFAALALSALSSATASAADLSYTYVDAGLSQSDLTGTTGGAGYSIAGSLGLPLGFFLDAKLDHADFDTHVVLGTAHMRRDTGHVGWEAGIMDRLDLVFRVGATHVESSFTGVPVTFTGGSYDANAGVRATLPAGFELEADLGLDDAPMIHAAPDVFYGAYVGPAKFSEHYADAAVRYHVTDSLLLGLSYRHATTNQPYYAGPDSSLSTLLVSARWAF